MPATRIYTVVLCFVVYACGGGTIPPEPEPLAKLEITDSFPPDGATNIPTQNNQILVQPSLALDPSSVNPDNVHLMPGDGNELHDMEENIETETDGKMDPIPGQVAYDPVSNTISFTPSQELKPGVTYHLRIHGVVLQDGTPLEDGNDTLQFSFTTADQLISEIKSYYQSGDNKGDIRWRQKYAYSVNGELKTITSYKPTGEISGVTKYRQPLPTGEIVRYINYAGEGTKILSYKKDIKNIEGEIIAHVTFVDAGADRIWGTTDDLLKQFADHNHEHNTHRISTYYVIKPSLREQGVTSVEWNQAAESFVPQFISLVEHQGPVFAHRQIYYAGPGEDGFLDFDEDGNPRPIDDRVALWYKRDFDQITGLRTAIWRMEGNLVEGDRTTIDPAKNEVLFTDLNAVKSLHSYTYKPSTLDGLRQLRDRIYTYTSPGPDNIWDTLVDNEFDSYISYEYDEEDFMTKQSVYVINEDGEEVLQKETVYSRTLL